MEILTNSPSDPVYLSDLLSKQSATALYQPIVSVKKGAVVGVESIGRAVHPEGRQVIEPGALQNQMWRPAESLGLDRLFRDKGLEGFRDIQSRVPGLLLFLGVDSAVLTRGTVGSGYLAEKVRALGLSPNSIVIELSRTHAMDMESVKRFVEAYRGLNFLIGLRDMDGSRENMDRVFNLNPDVFKLAPSLSSGLAKDPYKRDSLSNLMGLSRRMGSLVVAPGLENEEDSLAALELGVDLLQGDYFAKPLRVENTSMLGLKARIVLVGVRFKGRLSERMGRDKERKAKYAKIGGDILDRWRDVYDADLETRLSEILDVNPQLECLYMLNQDGVQVTGTVMNPRKFSDRKKYLFQPAPKGTDHSLKEYYYGLVYNSLDRYFTEPYISLASGNLCVTCALDLKGAEGGKKRILCLDIDVTNF